MTTPSKEGLKFSDEDRRKAADQTDHISDKILRPAFVTSMAPHWREVAILTQCRLNRAEELLEKMDIEPVGDEDWEQRRWKA